MAPTYTQQIEENFILWFETSNNYIILNKTLMKILTIFIKVSDKTSFLNAIVQDKELNYSVEEIASIYNDFTRFLKDQNTRPPLAEASITLFDDSNRIFNESYLIDTHAVQIYFSSEQVKQFIHPQLMHLALEKQKTNEHTTIFDIYEDDNFLYLFKNKQFIGNYPLANYHLLQGRFAMELLCVLHDKEENDWLGTFHASTVSNGKESIMLVGDSGHGKSTFCALLMAAGLDLMADDITPVLAKDQDVYRYPSAISIKQGAFDMLKAYYPDFEAQESFKGSVHKGFLKYIAPKHNTDNKIQHLPCSKIVYVKYDKHQAHTKLIPSAADKVLQTLIPDSWISPQKENAKQFLNWLQEISYYELSYSNNESAISTFIKLLDS